MDKTVKTTWVVLLLGVFLAGTSVWAAVTIHPIHLIYTGVGVCVSWAMGIQLTMIRDRHDRHDR